MGKNRLRASCEFKRTVLKSSCFCLTSIELLAAFLIMENPFKHIGEFRYDNPETADQPLILHLLGEMEQINDVLDEQLERNPSPEQAKQILHFFCEKSQSIAAEMKAFYDGFKSFPPILHEHRINRGESGFDASPI